MGVHPNPNPHLTLTLTLTYTLTHSTAGCRMGGPLVGLLHNPADPAQLLVRQADNTLRVVNTATMKVGEVGEVDK